jgi:exopolysaccharide production protein ExoZ
MINSEEGHAARRRVDEADIAASPAVQAGRDNLMGVQVLRGIAALMIVFHHYVGTSVERGFAISGLERAAVGNAGVDIFFIISGFIMEYTVGSRVFQSGDRGRFVARRLARILPLYWVLTLTAYLIATFLPFVVNSSTTTKQLMFSMVLLPDGAVGSYVLPLAWTLTYELYFYLLFAALLALKPLQRLLGLALIFSPSLFIPESVSAQNPIVGIILNPLVFEFFLGVLLAQIVMSGKAINHFASIALIIIGALMLVLELNNNVTDPMLRLFLWGVPALFIVAGVVLVQRPRQRVKPNLAVRIGAWLGDRSYSLYLSHFFAISIFAKIYFHYLINLSVPPWLSGLGLFLVSIVVAHVCYILIEKPARIALNAYFSRRKLQAQAA